MWLVFTVPSFDALFIRDQHTVEVLKVTVSLNLLLFISPPCQELCVVFGFVCVILLFFARSQNSICYLHWTNFLVGLLLVRWRCFPHSHILYLESIITLCNAIFTSYMTIAWVGLCVVIGCCFRPALTSIDRRCRAPVYTRRPSTEKQTSSGYCFL